MNNAVKVPSLSYSIGSKDLVIEGIECPKIGYIVWHGELAHTAKSLLAAQAKVGAEEVLKEVADKVIEVVWNKGVDEAKLSTKPIETEDIYSAVPRNRNMVKQALTYLIEYGLIRRYGGTSKKKGDTFKHVIYIDPRCAGNLRRGAPYQVDKEGQVTPRPISAGGDDYWKTANRRIAECEEKWRTLVSTLVRKN
jgi:hypothetical protein